MKTIIWQQSDVIVDREVELKSMMIAIVMLSE